MNNFINKVFMKFNKYAKTKSDYDILKNNCFSGKYVNKNVEKFFNGMHQFANPSSINKKIIKQPSNFILNNYVLRYAAIALIIGIGIVSSILITNYKRERDYKLVLYNELILDYSSEESNIYNYIEHSDEFDIDYNIDFIY